MCDALQRGDPQKFWSKPDSEIFEVERDMGGGTGGGGGESFFCARKMGAAPFPGLVLVVLKHPPPSPKK